jgi:hypothetical protein
MDDSGFQNLQVTHLRWPISQLQFWPSAAYEKRLNSCSS